MSRTGRPLKGAEKRDISFQMRMSKGTMDKLNECAEKLEMSRTDVIEKGIDRVYRSIKRK